MLQANYAFKTAVTTNKPQTSVSLTVSYISIRLSQSVSAACTFRMTFIKIINVDKSNKRVY